MKTILNQPDEQTMPRLRFPDFTDQWRLKPLGKYYQFLSTNSYSRAQLNYETGTVYNIHYGDIHKKFSARFILANENVPFVNRDVPIERIPRDSYCKEGDIIIADASEDYAEIGRSIEIIDLNGKMVLAGLHTLQARPLTDQVISGYSAYAMASPSVRKQIMRIAQGTKVLGISATRMSALYYPIPSKPEQEKIAALLSGVDSKISILSKKKSLFEKYKFGWMQNLLSKNIRFTKEAGGSYPDWRTQKLSSVLELCQRPVPKPQKPYLALGIRSHMKGTFQRPDVDPDSIALDTLFEVHKDDLIVNITFAWEGAIAIARSEDHGGLVSHRFPTYRCKDGKLSKAYAEQIIRLRKFKHSLDLISPGGAGRNRVLSKKEFLKLEWELPSYHEQEKIAAFLSVIDAKIAQVENQLDLAKNFKKGLLQQMFV